MAVEEQDEERTPNQKDRFQDSPEGTVERRLRKGPMQEMVIWSEGKVFFYFSFLLMQLYIQWRSRRVLYTHGVDIYRRGPDDVTSTPRMSFYKRVGYPNGVHDINREMTSLCISD